MSGYCIFWGLDIAIGFFSFSGFLVYSSVKILGLYRLLKDVFGKYIYLFKFIEILVTYSYTYLSLPGINLRIHFSAPIYQ